MDNIPTVLPIRNQDGTKISQRWGELTVVKVFPSFVDLIGRGAMILGQTGQRGETDALMRNESLNRS